MNIITDWWVLWLWLLCWLASLRPLMRGYLHAFSDERDDIRKAKRTSQEDRLWAFVCASLTALLGPIVLVGYLLFRAVSPTIVTNADRNARLREQEAENARLREWARRNGISYPEPPSAHVAAGRCPCGQNHD